MRRLISLVLAVAVICCMTIPALAVEIAVPLTAEPVTFRIMVARENLSQNSYPDKECVQFTEQQTGIHIEWEEVPSSAWTEKVSLAFASGDLPDAFLGKVDVVSNMDQLTALDGYFAEAPNILEMFETLPDIRGSLTLSDGHIYSLPIGDADVKNQINTIAYINKVWLEKLNLAMPTTVDEFYNVLVAFRDNDPNGNGEKDEIPLLVSASSNAAKINNLFCYFGTMENNGHVRVQDGKVIFTPSEDAYFEALQFIHKLYAEGLMNSEYYTEDFQQFQAKGAADPCRVGVCLEWYIDNIIGGAHVADFTYMSPLTGPHGDMIWCSDLSPNSPVGNLAGFTITTACKDPGLLVRWYDYINSNLDILNLWNYGPENVIWRYTDDGRWELFNDNVPEGSSSSQIRRTLGTGPAGPLYAYSRFRGPQAEKYAARIAAKVEANSAYAPYLPAETLINGFGDADEEAERNLLLTEIDHYLDQFRANAVVQGITEADWQKHLERLKTLSIDEYLGYWQSYYDAHK